MPSYPQCNHSEETLNLSGTDIEYQTKETGNLFDSSIAKSSEVNINDILPEEILLQIFSNLYQRPDALITVPEVCRQWARLLHDNNLWKSLCSSKNFSPILKDATNNQIQKQSQSDFSQLKIRCRCNSAMKITCDNKNAMEAYAKGRKRCNVIWKGVSLAPWKAVYRQNYLTFINWMTGKFTIKPVFPSDFSALCLAFNENWAVVIAQGLPGKLINVQTGECHMLLDEHEGIISAVKLEKKYVITGGVDSTVRVWSIETRERLKVLAGHRGEIVSIQCNAEIIVSGSEDNEIQESSKPFPLNYLYLFNETGSIDQDIAIWSWKTGKIVKKLQGHQGCVYCIQAYGDELYSGSSDGLIKRWNLNLGKSTQNLRGHDSGVICLLVDSFKIVSGSGDYSVKVWDKGTGNCLYTLKHHNATVWGLNLFGTKLMTSSFDTSLVVLDFAEEIIDE
ncbi:SCF ubiquitin ligase complex subunit cdc4 [Physocladia obscura]|uniref:SCF ubiquitin ligase complex subunit cdc4 n=1 Tax=Physocladia obscura TaxID=109957 RepID=A0AAD5TFM6_9FUNG|nr:SCF ubiquitin ligase complex subunit cdc4 [Physocladia obscura]